MSRIENLPIRGLIEGVQKEKDINVKEGMLMLRKKKDDLFWLYETM